MFRNYFKSTFRKLLKDRQYTLINVAGLSTGFALFLIIALYVQRELAIDKHHTNHELIYRVNTEYTNNDGIVTQYASGYQPTAAALSADFPEVETAAMFFSPAAQFSFRSNDQLISVENDKIYYTTDAFFEVFSHQWIDRGNQLSAPNTVVISDHLATRFFGTEDPMGKTLTYEDRGQKHSLEVTGVFEKTNEPSHLDYDMLINYDSGINFWKGGIDNNWGFMYVYTYFKANQPLALNTWDEKLAGLREKYKPNSTGIKFSAQALTDIYWEPSEFEPGTSGNRAYIYVFGAFGLTVILLAIVNFVNLMTARSIRRSKEVAVRKIVGANRSGLMMQFLVESTVLSLIAMVLGGVVAERLISPINTSLDLSLAFNVFGNPLLLVMVFLIPLTVGLLSGIYPALVLSSFKAHSLLGGRAKWSVSHEHLRSGLLSLQFLISVLVISSVLVIGSQMNYIKTQGLGFNSDPVLVLPRISNDSNYLIRQAVAENPDIKGIASLSSIPGYRTPRQRNIKENGTTGDGILTNGIWVSEQYADIIDLNFTAGRNFTIDDREDVVILNERAVGDLGWDKFEAIGKQIVMTGRNGFDATTYEIVGVIEDYHYQSMYEAVAPLFLKNNAKSRSGGDASIVQVAADNLDETLAYLSQTWSEIETLQAFDYYFLDDAVNEVYEKEIKLSKTVNYVSAISIVVCLLGLFGLVSLNLQSKRKEIGIRKVLGASGQLIAQLFARKYLWIILISILIGLPLSYKLLQLWLSNFEYAVSYSFFTYFGVGLTLIVVSLGLVSLQSINASRVNPVDSLRDE